MVYPLWTFGLALGMSLAMFLYQQYGEHRRRQEESSQTHEQRWNNNFSDHDNWQSPEPSTSEGSYSKHRGEKKNENKKNEMEEKSTVVGEEELCGICTKPLKSNLRKIHCGHTFHPACLIEWRRINDECPDCGVKFD